MGRAIHSQMSTRFWQVWQELAAPVLQVCPLEHAPAVHSDTQKYPAPSWIQTHVSGDWQVAVSVSPVQRTRPGDLSHAPAPSAAHNTNRVNARTPWFMTPPTGRGKTMAQQWCGHRYDRVILPV